MLSFARLKRQPLVVSSALASVVVCFFTFATIINCLTRSRSQAQFPHFCWWPLFLTLAITGYFVFHCGNNTIERYQNVMNAFIATDLAATSFAIYLLASARWERLLALAGFVIHSIIMSFWLVYFGRNQVVVCDSNKRLDEETGGVNIALQDPEWPYRARALYDYDANDDDPNEISFSKGELLYVSDISQRWWSVKNANDKRGTAPMSLLCLLGNNTAASTIPIGFST